MSLIDFLFSNNITEAKRIISERIEKIVSAKLEEKKKQLSEEYLKEYVPNIQKIGRSKLIRIRIRGGKVQRRKKVSGVQGFTYRSGRLTRMSQVERRKRRMSAMRARLKRRAKMGVILRKRKLSLRKRRSLGLR
jgi:hypothetical protein